MTFLAPLAAILAAAIVLPSLVLMYFLKLRRRQVDVPTTLLWRKSIQDLQASAPFQKLRRNLMLILQLLVLLGLLIALARPTVDGWATSGKRVVIVIDHSASMNATDTTTGESRLAAAKRLAIALAADASRGQGAMVVSLAREAQIVEPFTEDGDRLKHAIESIGRTDEPGRLAPALALLEQFARQESGLDVYIISDGRFPPQREMTLQGHATIRLMRVGSESPVHPVHNLGIVALAARRDFQNTQRVEIFTGVSNDSPEPVKIKLAVKVDNQLVRMLDATAAPTPANQDKVTVTPVSFTMEQTGSSLVEVMVSRATADAAQTTSTQAENAATRDPLSTDDRAWLMVSPQRHLRALQVGDASRFTSRALSAAGLAQVDRISAQAYEAMAGNNSDEAKLAGYDLIVFDGYEPKFAAPSNALYMGAGAPAVGVTRVKEDAADASVNAQVVLSWRRDHELMRYAGLDEVVLGQAVRLEVPADAQVLATTAAGPLMAAVDRQGRRSVVVGFEPVQSNWPLLVGFPVFVSNAVQWLGATSVDQGGLVSQPGAVTSAPLNGSSVGGGERTVRYESITESMGRTNELLASAAGGQLMIPPALRVGVYLTADTSVRPPWNTLAVSLLDAVESDLRPVETLVVGTQAIETIAPQATKVRQEVHTWFLWAALAVLLGEWVVYLRRSRM